MLLMVGGAAILERRLCLCVCTLEGKGRNSVGNKNIWKSYFRSEYAFTNRTSSSQCRFYAYKRKLFTTLPERRCHPILDVEKPASLVNLALALAATVTTQQAVHGPALFAKLDVTASPLHKVSSVDGAANKEDKKDDSAHKRMRYEATPNDPPDVSERRCRRFGRKVRRVGDDARECFQDGGS